MRFQGIDPLDVAINTISETQQEAHITLTSSELEPRFEEAYERFRPTVELRGFRKGKVPMEMIKRLYGKAIEEEALEDIANTTYREAMDEKHIEPIGRPSLIDMDFQRGKSFSFKITYEIKPAITLNKYQGLNAEKLVHTVTDEELDAEIGQIRRANSTKTEVQTVTDEEHIVTAAVQELDEHGTPLIGKKTSQTTFLLSDTTLVQEIRDALRTAEVGGTYRAHFSSQHEDHIHAVTIDITVKKIEKVHLPPLDEALIKKVTGEKVSTEAEFRSNIRADITRYWADQADRKLTNDLIDELVRQHEIPVPQSMVDAFLETFVEDIKSRSRDGKLPAGFDEAKFKEESRANAVWQAKWMLIRDQIAATEQISVTDNDLVALAESDAAKTGIEKDRLLQYYRKTHSVADRVLTDRVVALLKSSAKITEKPDVK